MNATLESVSPPTLEPSAPGRDRFGPVDPALGAALESWRRRLAAAGMACREVAFSGPGVQWTLAFESAPAAAAWPDLRARVTPASPVALTRVDAAAGADLLLATLVQLPGGETGIAGAALAPPHSERTMQGVLLSLGWLQLGLLTASLEHNQRAAGLLEQLGHVAAQRGARVAAQEWVNRSAASARALAPALDGLTLMLFEVRNGVAHGWVGADTAWAEKGSPAVVEASEIAARAAAQNRELVLDRWWAMALQAGGQTAAVLVARCDDCKASDWPAQMLALLRANASVTEPLLRRWREAERSLPGHALASVREAWRKLWGPGHLTWKAGAVALLLGAGVLLVWPVADRVNASVVIEGRVRQLVTAPFDGFIAQVLVRPGAQVHKGQLLARLDDRDLLLEQGKHRSEREQAAGKLRQAMAERDAPALAMAAAELKQTEAQLALVDAKLARATLRAPMDGLVVTGDWVQQIGGPVETGKEMFELAASDGYRVVLQVPDQDIARVQAGQPGALRLAGQPHASHGFRVNNVTAMASVQDGGNGFRVEAAWEGAVPPLRPGMQGVGKITVGEANLLTVWTRSSIDWLRLKLWSWWW